MNPECDPPRKKSLKKTIEQRHILHTKTRSVSAHLGKAVSLQMNPHVLDVDGCCIVPAAAVCVIFVRAVCANSKHLLVLPLPVGNASCHNVVCNLRAVRHVDVACRKRCYTFALLEWVPSLSWEMSRLFHRVMKMVKMVTMAPT
jgi:hypothetical protein